MDNQLSEKVKLRVTSSNNRPITNCLNLSTSINRDNPDSPKQKIRMTRRDFCENIRACQCNQRPRSTSEYDKSKKHKSVTFADVLGNNADIRIYDSNLPPQVPDYVFSELRICRSHSPSPEKAKNFTFVHNFVPNDNGNVEQHVRTRNVSLHRLLITEEMVYGIVVVSNIAFDKLIFIRSTSDNWISYKDYEANFNSSLSQSVDQFSFKIPIRSNCCSYGFNLEFVICFKCGGHEFWDNNNGKNYSVKQTASED